MIASNIISDYILPLQVSDNGEKALVQMHEHNVSQLPVVDGTTYVGVVSMEEVVNMKHLSKPIKDFTDLLRKPFVEEGAHVYEVMRTALEHNVRIVPVVDEEHQYKGIISAESCLRAFAELNSVKDPGGIIELEQPLKDYSLSELARVVEENDATIVSFYTHAKPDGSKMEITIKLNTTSLGGLVAAFERYGYEVKDVHNEKEYSEDLKDRYDALMRYLNV